MSIFNIAVNNLTNLTNLHNSLIYRILFYEECNNSME